MMKKRILPLLLSAVLCVTALVITPGAERTAEDAGAVCLVFNNILSMTAKRPDADRAVVVLEGYKDGNDGGGGTFIWDATSEAEPNGGTVFAPSRGGGAGRFIRVCDPSDLNARWFGALSGVGDGEAIQSAIDALPADGGTVRLPGGDYRIERPIVIGDGEGGRKAVKLVGEGGTFGHMTLSMTKLTCAGGMDAVIHVRGPISDCEISGMLIYGEKANYAVRITGMSNSRVNNLHMVGGNVAAILIESAPGEDGATHDCVFRQIGGNPVKSEGTVMIIDGGTSGNPVRDCVFEACRWDTAQTKNSVAVRMKLAEKNTFRRCHFNVYQFETSVGLLLDPEGNDGYPKQNAFYDCSVTRLKILEPYGADIGYNYVFGHGTWDNEEYTPSDKLFGLTDLGEIVWYGATGKKQI